MSQTTPTGTEAGFDLDKLEVLAKAAKNPLGPWYRMSHIQDGILDNEDARYIAAATPDTILDLIALARRAAPATSAQPVQAGEAVTRESALAAIAYVEQSNSHGRAAEARASLAPVSAQPDPDFWVSVQHGEPKIDYMDRSDSAYKWFPVYRKPVSAQQGAAIPADWCKDCVGQGIKTSPVPPDGDDTCETCNGTGLAAKAPAAQAVMSIDTPEYRNLLFCYLNASLSKGAREKAQAALTAHIDAKLATSPASAPEAMKSEQQPAAPYGYVLKTGHGNRFSEDLTYVHEEVRHMWKPVYLAAPATAKPAQAKPAQASQ